MKPEDRAWQKLVEAARRVQDDRDATAPYGFSTRVAAQAMQRRSPGVLLERFSWRALVVAALLALGGVATNYASSTTAAEDELPFDETVVTAVFDLS